MRTEELDDKAETPEFTSGITSGPVDTEVAQKPAGSMSGRPKMAVLVIVAALAIAAGMWYLHAQTYETTDDAQIDGHINSLSSRIAGTVEKVYVEDNQLVQSGQSLIDLDTRELVIAEQQSRAQYAEALAHLSSDSPNIAITRNSNEAQIALAQSQLGDAQAALEAAAHDRQSAASRLAEAQATAKRDQLQADRYKQLYDRDETSRQEFENYSAAAQASSARFAAAKAALSSAEKVVQQRRAQVDGQVAHARETSKNAPHQLAIRLASEESQRAGVDLARAERDQAELNLSFARIVAPVSGVVTQRSAEPGNHVAQGEQLLMIVDTSHLWVTANFKETQLHTMHPGCRAVVKVDALGRTFEGTVESMPAITGSRASVLPPENATGNYVKVVQRLPVRIQLTPSQPQIAELRPGMSVDAKVYLK